MAGDLSLARDWIDVICTGIQTLLAIIGLVFVSFWWDRRKTKDQRKRADKQRREEERQMEIQREEDRQRADAEKIAAILSENYYKVETIFRRLKRNVDKLREENIVGDLTEFHILLYMCHPDNWQRFETINTFHRNTPGNQIYTRRELLLDVEEIMKFFLKFRINLFSIMQNKACPSDIKLEFSTKITEMGRTIYPFVEKHRQGVIKRVLRYFVDAATVQEHVIPQSPEAPSPRARQCCFPRRLRPGLSRCCGRQETHEVEMERLVQRSSFEMSPVADPPNANQPSREGNEEPELTRYPGNSAVEQAIPYIECFSYENGRMHLQFRPYHEGIGIFLTRVELGEMQGREDEILEKINELWQFNEHQPPGGGLLHSVRMIMFELSKDPNFFNRREGSFDLFKSYVRQLVDNSSDELNKRICEYALSDINTITEHFRRDFKSLFILTETKDMLQNVRSMLEQFMVRRNQLQQQLQQQQQQQQLQQQQL